MTGCCTRCDQTVSLVIRCGSTAKHSQRLINQTTLRVAREEISSIVHILDDVHPVIEVNYSWMAPANEKQQAHQLLDQLDAGQLAAVVHLLQVMTGPLSRSLASAPVEEEEITSETAAALDRARASLARGEGIPHEDIMREFGLDK